MTTYRFTEPDEFRSLALPTRVAKFIERNWPFAAHHDYREWWEQAAPHIVDIIIGDVVKIAEAPRHQRVGCIVCWMDPKVTGDAIKDINVIYDGNGYCAEHYRAVLSYLVGRGQRGTLPRSEALPMILAGIATEVS